MTEENILDLYWCRSESAIDETDSKYGKYCFAVANNILSDIEDSEESVNDTYLQAWNTIPPIRPNSLSAYLGKIVRNISLNRIKAKKTQKRGSGEYELVYEELAYMISSPQSANDLIDEISLNDLMNQWLGTLAQEKRLVFVGRYWYFDSIAAISSKMNFSVSKTKMLLLRLRNELKDFLESEDIHL